MNIIIIGGNGQLGSDLTRIFKGSISLTHEDIEVTDRKSCEILRELNPDIIINTAGFHKTDECEIYPEKAFAVNAIGAKNIAEISDELDAINIFISTDYVFDGTKETMYSEQDIPNPINTYGITKLAGELFTKNYCQKYYIIRVASLFGIAGSRSKKGNFVETMIKMAKNNIPIKVINDIVMTPTYTLDAAMAVKLLIEKNAQYGIYHVVNTGETTWYNFAREIFNILNLEDVDLSPVSSTEYDLSAKRPKNSALSNDKIKRLGISLRQWKDALKEYLLEKGYI